MKALPLASRWFSSVSSLVCLHALCSVGRLTAQVADEFQPLPNGAAMTAVPLANGDILLGGGFGSVNNLWMPNLAKVSRDGGIDPMFYTRPNSTVYSIVVLPSGKILIGGTFTEINGSDKVSLARLNEDASLETNFVCNANGAVYAMALQPDGKVVCFGDFTAIGGQTHVRIARLNIDGTVDTSFSPSINGALYAMAAQPDGKLLISGSFTAINGTSRNYFARLNNDGTLDSSFAPPVSGNIYSIVVQPDEKIIIAGSIYTGGGYTHYGIARFKKEGTVDQSFDAGYIAGPDIYSMALQADGKVMIGGAFNYLAGNGASYLARLLTNGNADVSYSASPNSTVLSMTPQPDGKLIVSGYFNSVANVIRQFMARVAPSGPRAEDLQFNGNTIRWLRSGGLPELPYVSLDISSNAVDWIALPPPTRIAGGWQLDGLNSAPQSWVRVRAPVTGGFGNASVYQLQHIYGPVIITAQPQNTTNSAGSTVTLSIGSIGEPSWYQWRKGGVPLQNTTNITGADTATLSLADASGALRGEYSVVVSNSFGAVTSSVAIVEVLDPFITLQPNGGSFLWSGYLQMFVSAAGTQPLCFQWRKDGIPLSAATNTYIERLAVSKTDEGSYDVIVSNTYGSVTSTVAMVTVIDPAILEFSGTQTLNPGQNAHFSVAAVGTPTLQYTWRKDSVPFLTGTNVTITLSNVTATAAGWYDVVVTGAYSSVTSMPALLTVDESTVDSFHPTAEAPVLCAAVQSDGGLLVGGDFYTINGYAHQRIARITPNGLVDNSFLTWADGAPWSMIIQPDNKILILGDLQTVNGTPRGSLARLHPNGSLEETFNPGLNGWLNNMALQPDGKIIIAGELYDSDGYPIPAVRLLPDGSLDTTFNPGVFGAAIQAVLQQNGQILLVGGFMDDPTDSQTYHSVRLNADGSLDRSFSSRVESEIYGILLQPDGKILVRGYYYGTNDVYLLWRLNSDGSLDTTFSPTMDGNIYTFSLQADGRILVAGESFDYEAPFVWRLNADGTRDPHFGPLVSGSVYDMAPQADGKVIIVGSFFQMGPQSRENIARISNPTPATESLGFTDGLLSWMRGGSTPEVWRATVERSTDGTNWNQIANAGRTPGGWQATLGALPPNSWLRVRGFTAEDHGSYFVERVIRPPSILTQPGTITVYIGQPAVLSVAATGAPALRYQWYRDGLPLTDATNSSLVIASAQLSDDASYWVAVVNDLGSITSTTAFVTVLPTLESALDTTNIVWLTGGYAPWAGQTLITHDIEDAARSGVITHNQQSWVETTVLGPGSLSFWWKVSSEPEYDFLEFRTNGTLVTRVSGEVAWQQRTFTLAAGPQVLRWRYVKDDTVTVGKDRGWLDEVSYFSWVPTLTAVTPSAAKSVEFQVTCRPGRSVVIEGSTNLVNWVPVATNNGGAGWFKFSDPDATAHPTRFYRVQTP